MSNATIAELQEQKLESLIDFFKSYVSRTYSKSVRVMILDSNSDYITLKQLEEVTNDCLHKQLGSYKYPEGIRTKTSKREVVIYRQVFCIIALRTGYGPSEIGTHLNISHATVIHSRGVMDNLLEYKNPQATLVYKDINNEIKKRYGFLEDITA